MKKLVFILVSLMCFGSSIFSATNGWGDGVNIQASYYGPDNLDIGWGLMDTYSKIATVRIEIEPFVAIATAKRWISEANTHGKNVICTYHQYQNNGSDDANALMGAANWWKTNYTELAKGGNFTVNLMNEWGSHGQTPTSYSNAYNNAIKTVRDVYNGNIIIDIPGWGQETNCAAEASSKITDNNITFSVHIYSSAYVQYGSSGWLSNAHLDVLANAGRPVIVGEFGSERTGSANWSSLIDYANSKGWTILGWAWNGDGENPPMNMIDPSWNSNRNATTYTPGGYFNTVYNKLKNSTVIPVTGVSLDKTSASLAQGAVVQLTATVAPANATNKKVSYSSGNTNVATVNATGLVTAVGVGTATITVTTESASKTATCAITVTPTAVTGVSIAPTSVILSQGGTQQLTASVIPAGATNKSVSYTSSNTSVATVSASGLVTAVASTGNAVITVKTQEGSFTATCEVTVTPMLQNVALNKTVTTSTNESASHTGANAVDGNATTTRWSSTFADNQWAYVNLGQKYTINKVVLNWEVASGKDYTIDVSDDAINWTTISTKTAMPNGARIDNITGLSNVCQYVRMNGKTRTTAWGFSLFEFEVYGTPYDNPVVHVTGISFSPASISMCKGTTMSPVITVMPANATNKKVIITPINGPIIIFNNGLITAVGLGSATLTATSDDGGFTATCIVTVTDCSKPVTGVTLTPASATLTSIGQTLQLTKAIIPSDATNQNVTFATNNAAVATVNSTGLVTAIAAGNAIITVTTQEGSFKATSSITVIPSTCTLLSRFAVPAASALPNVDNVSYKNLYLLGTGGPNMASINNFTINWSLQYNGLWQYSFNLNVSPWWLDLLPKITQNFNSASPACKITGSGIAGLDGDYWVNMDGANFVMVAKSGAYAIYMSNSTTPPAACNTLKSATIATNVSENRSSNVSFYPSLLRKGDELKVKLSGNAKVAIVDANGRTVFNQILNNSSSISINDNFATGLYFITIVENNNVTKGKLIIR